MNRQTDLTLTELISGIEGALHLPECFYANEIGVIALGDTCESEDAQATLATMLTHDDPSVRMAAYGCGCQIQNPIEGLTLALAWFPTNLESNTEIIQQVEAMLA